MAHAAGGFRSVTPAAVHPARQSRAAADAQNVRHVTTRNTRIVYGRSLMFWTFEPGSNARLAILVVAVLILIISMITSQRYFVMKSVILLIGIIGTWRELNNWKRRREDNETRD